MYESLRRRITTVRKEVKDAPFHPSMMGVYYYPGDAPESRYTDDDGYLNLIVPGALTPLGEKLHMPCQHLVIGIPRKGKEDNR